MISVKKIQPVLPVQLRKDSKDFIMHLDNVLHAAVLPEFVPIPKLNIRKSPFVIIFQRRKIQMLVFQEIIRGGSNPPVAVAHQDIARAVCQRQNRGIPKSMPQPR